MKVKKNKLSTKMTSVNITIEAAKLLSHIAAELRETRYKVLGELISAHYNKVIRKK